jgi:hypothetical protein
MKRVHIQINGIDVDFETSQEIAELIARKSNPESIVLAWHDKRQKKHSPAAVQCDTEEFSGWEEYGRHHGGKWEIDINNKEYTFVLN